MHFENVPFYTTNEIIKYINITYDTCRLVDHIDHCTIRVLGFSTRDIFGFGIFKPETFRPEVIMYAIHVCIWYRPIMGFRDIAYISLYMCWWYFEFSRIIVHCGTRMS